MIAPPFADSTVDLDSLGPVGRSVAEVRQSLFVHGVLAVIPPRSNQREPVACDFQSDKDRNRIERMFNRIKQFRRIATRYDKTAKSFLTFLNLAAAKTGDQPELAKTRQEII